MRNYLNYAAVGPLSRAARNAIERFLADYARLGPTVTLLKYRTVVGRLYAEVARLIHCDESEVVYIKNTTEGIIIASETLPLEVGDEVVLLDNEYSANCIPWLKKRNDGLVLRLASGTSNAGRYDSIVDQITSRTRVVSVSWVHYYDGYMADLHELSRLCKEHDIFLVVDAIQAMGTRQIDMSELNIAFLLCGGHKHLGAPMGSGFMYVNRNVLAGLKHYKVSTRSVDSFGWDGYKIKQTAQRFEDGSPDLLAVIALYHAISELNQIGIKEVELRGEAKLTTIKGMLTELGIIFIDHARQGNIISLPTADPDSLLACFRRHNLSVKIIQDGVRVSFNYNTSGRTLRALAACLRDAKHLRLV
jgi:cysteine desulfurase / selenocysteine lyase